MGITGFLGSLFGLIWFNSEAIDLLRGLFVCPVRLSPMCMAVRTLYGPVRERVRDPVHLEV